MKNILITIVAGIALMPMLVYGQINTMHFCCSRQVGGGCSPIAYPNETACKAACTETESCEVRSVGAAAVAPVASVVPPMASPMAPYGYPAYGAGVPNIEAIGAAIDTAAQAGVLPARAPVTTTVAGMPVEQTMAPPVATTVRAPTAAGATRQVTTVTTTTTGRATPVAATSVAADMVGTGTAATNVPGNQVR